MMAGPETRGEPVGKEYDDLPDGIEVLQDMLREAKMQLRRVQPGLGVRQATLEIVKKTGAPNRGCWRTRRRRRWWGR